ncbi:MAG: hypothetical protein ACUVSZ_18735 [Chloroflexus sp.]|uniref:hypothetical protein n=1 Tax=Chloroflexus sp. TaxID=1904827 RepID=UPI00404A7FA3
MELEKRILWHPWDWKQPWEGSHASSTTMLPQYGLSRKGQDLSEGNIVIHSRNDKRSKCMVCKTTFVASRGTPFYWLRHPPEWFTIVVTLIAYGGLGQAIVAAFQRDERTVIDWQKRAGQHCRKVHTYLVQPPRDLDHVHVEESRIKAQRKVRWLTVAITV